jgi:hypothetical protein
MKNVGVLHQMKWQRIILDGKFYSHVFLGRLLRFT